MKEKLIIKNFGPIKSVELDLGRFNILIGEQATGKSTVAKLLAVCRYFSYVVKGADTFNDFIDGPFFVGLTAWGLRDFININSYIFYRNAHYSVKVEANKIELNNSSVSEYDEKGEMIFDEKIVEHIVYHPELTPISDKFKKLLSELNKLMESGSLIVPTSFFLNDVKNVLDNPFYLPTQRGLQSIFDIGQNSIQNLSSALFTQLSKMDGIARLYKQETYIEPLDIYYVNRNGHGFIRKANETEFYSLYNAASGYQSIIPIVLTIKNYTENKRRNKTFLIEEIEQNLFPSAQNKLMQYVIEKIVNAGNGAALVTTQSPYILTSLNNMMYAHEIGKTNPDATANIINKKYWLNPDEVSAYMMKSDGTAENIVDDEVKQIKAERIDEISRQFNKEYDDMLDLKYTVKQ